MRTDRYDATSDKSSFVAWVSGNRIEDTSQYRHAALTRAQRRPASIFPKADIACGSCAAFLAWPTCPRQASVMRAR